MLPRATQTRSAREVTRGRPSGRAAEIQRLIGRSLRAVIDLDYSEDSRAQVDLNLVATGSGRVVEVQGTAEGRSFSRQELDAMVDLGFAGIHSLIAKQDEVLTAIRRDIAGIERRGRRRQVTPKSEAELWGKPT